MGGMKHKKGPPRGSAKRVGLPRFRQEQWSRWLELVADGEVWPDTFQQWQAESDAMAERLRRTGLEVVWVDLDAEQFAVWCQSRGYRNDREARNRFAAERIGNIPPPSA
jgi:hypothetical protein